MINKIIFTRFILLIVIVFCITATQAQENIPFKEISVTELPKEIKYQGEIKSAIRWNDKTGDNLVITTETGVYHDNNEYGNEGSHTELYAYHYIINDSSIIENWKVYDYVYDCPVDIKASFIKKPDITDLDNNGIAEVWLIYEKICRGDVSPSDMKIIMYEGKQKFAMRGQTKVFGGIDDNGVTHYIGGDYKFDEAFNNGANEFLKFAMKLWNNNIED